MAREVGISYDTKFATKKIAELPGAAASVSQRFGRILNRGP